LQPNYTLI
jgi:hypothetical protein